MKSLSLLYTILFYDLEFTTPCWSATSSFCMAKKSPLLLIRTKKSPYIENKVAKLRPHMEQKYFFPGGGGGGRPLTLAPPPTSAHEYRSAY